MAKQPQTMTATCTYKAKVIDVDAMKYETRCSHRRCNKILFKGILGAGTRIEIKCQGCGNMTVLQIVPSS